MSASPETNSPNAESRIAHLSTWRKVLYSLLPLLLVLTLIEGGARILEHYFPPRPLDLGLAFTDETRHCRPVGPNGELLRPHSKGPSLEDSTFTARKADNTFRIFTLGGSSVAFLQDDLVELEAQLTEEYKDDFDAVEIINAGFWSYGSQRVLIVARELLEYDPDLFVLYSGHNEFEDLKQLEVAEQGPPLLLRILTHSAVFRLVADRVTNRRLNLLEKQRNLDVLRRDPFPTPEEWKAEITPDVLDERMDHYQDNLSLIAQMCKQRGVPLIIGTVPSNHWDPSLPGDIYNSFSSELLPLREAGHYEEYFQKVRDVLSKSLRRQASDTENAIIREVATTYALPIAEMRTATCEAEPHGIPGETLFADPCHLNEKGNDLWIKVYTPLIRDAIDRYLARRAEQR